MAVSTSDNRLISVIIPTYNRAHLIERSVTSVLRSSYTNIEVIVVDDASTDNTESVLSAIEDPRLKYIRLPENHGANHARNVGLDNAKGNYISFNDSDDEWCEDKLFRLLEYFDTLDDSYGMVYCDIEISSRDSTSTVHLPAGLGHDIKDISGNIFEYMLENMFISMISVLIKREVFDKTGKFNEDLKRLQDWELFLRISKNYQVGYLPQTLAKAQNQSDSLSNNYRNMAKTIMYVMDLYDAKRKYPKQFATMKLTVLKCIEETDGPDKLKLIPEVNEWVNKHKEEETKVTDNESKSYLEELFYANVFNSTITGSKWWHYEISPGNMAVGYPFLYVLYRILDEVKPSKILELGLGQSSLMTTAYGSTFPCEHTIIEHDKEWIEFFKHKLHGDNYTIFNPNMVVRDVEGNKVNMYDDISPVAFEKKYDLIIIDAPYGSENISRIDVLNYVPEILEKDFILMLHDAQRKGEYNTYLMFENMLREDNVPFNSNYYPGIQYTYVATSPSLRFICTL